MVALAEYRCSIRGVPPSRFSRVQAMEDHPFNSLTRFYIRFGFEFLVYRVSPTVIAIPSSVKPAVKGAILRSLGWMRFGFSDSTYTLITKPHTRSDRRFCQLPRPLHFPAQRMIASTPYSAFEPEMKLLD